MPNKKVQNILQAIFDVCGPNATLQGAKDVIIWGLEEMEIQTLSEISNAFLRGLNKKRDIQIGKPRKS